MKQNEENVPVINRNNINPKRYLNRSKFHFINYGNSVFVKNIRKVLSNLIWRDGRSNSNYMQNSFSLSISPQNSLDISESSNIFEDDRNKMQILKHFSTWTSLVAHLNINSLRKKSEMVVETITCCSFEHQLFQEENWNGCWNYHKCWYIFNFGNKNRFSFR